MKFLLTKVDAAVDQLDWSIRLFMDHQAYIASITLAGAAEEVLGQAVGDAAAFTVLKHNLSVKYNLSEKTVSQDHLNQARNWLKHWDQLKDNETLEIELEAEAIQYIVRALANLCQHDKSVPSQGLRFMEWLATNRSHLFEYLINSDQSSDSLNGAAN